MSFNSSWAPNEDAQTIFSERCWLQGSILSVLAYGICLPMYFSCFRLLTRDRHRICFRKRLPLISYLVITFFLGTLYAILIAAGAQMAFIDNRNYPGGPNAFITDMFGIPINETANVAYIMMNWLSDALVVWRLKVIYQNSRIPIWIVLFFPCLMLAGSVALGIMCLIQDSVTSPFTVTNFSFTLPYGIVSLTLNIGLTIAIVFRLMSFKYRIISVMGSNFGSHYTSVVSIVIESAASYAVICITFLILFGVGNPVSQAILQPLTQFQVISTLFIVFRVAQGKAWNSNTGASMVTTWRPETTELRIMGSVSPAASRTLRGSGEAVNSTDAEFQDGSHFSKKIVVLKEEA